jgi:hypothetical protein
MDPLHVTTVHSLAMLVDNVEGRALGHRPHGEGGKKLLSVAALVSLKRGQLLDCFGL